MLDFLCRCLVACALLGALGSTFAQTYPDRPIRLVVAFVPEISTALPRAFGY